MLLIGTDCLPAATRPAHIAMANFVSHVSVITQINNLDKLADCANLLRISPICRQFRMIPSSNDQL